MKKLLCIMMMFLALGGALYSEQVFEVDTKSGIKTVVVPDGYSTEEVLCQIAKAYYELDEDYDTLTIQYEDLAEEVNPLQASDKSRIIPFLALHIFFSHMILCRSNISHLSPCRIRTPLWIILDYI